MTHRLPVAFALMVLMGTTGSARAQAIARDGQPDVGFRALVLLGRGEPSNDMIGSGVMGRWRWKYRWYWGLAIDRVSFDYERPYDVLRIPSTREVDGSNDLTRVVGWIERRYDLQERSWDWFWTAGIGVASVDAEDGRGSGPGGGTPHITTDADDEFHLLLSTGIQRPFGDQFMLEATLSLERYSNDYKLVDGVSGATGEIGPQTPIGVSLGVNYRF